MAYHCKIDKLVAFAAPPSKVVRRELELTARGAALRRGDARLDHPRQAAGARLDPGVSARSSARCAQGGYGKSKVGHGGTLDPLATGVLPIAIGEATKLAGRMLDSDKVYDFTIPLRRADRHARSGGRGIATSDVRPTLAEVEAVLPRFTGADRAGAAGLFGAEGRRRARLRPRAGGRRGRADEPRVTIHKLYIRLPGASRRGSPSLASSVMRLADRAGSRHQPAGDDGAIDAASP